MSDYATPEKRKSKRDKKAKRRYRVYKRGGSLRTIKVKNKKKGKK